MPASFAVPVEAPLPVPLRFGVLVPPIPEDLLEYSLSSAAAFLA
jgi:hypothetical protein